MRGEMNQDSILQFLLDGDVSIQYQTYRDLMEHEKPDLRERIAKEGWGAEFLSRQREDGHWGKKYYQPKWTSTHYTILDLKNLGVTPDLPTVQNTIRNVLATTKSPDGGILPIGSTKRSDVCLNGMFLNFAAYFKMPQEDLQSIVDFILSEHMADGGFNCQSNRKGAVHSSLHTTLSILEGFHEYKKTGYSHRVDDIQEVEPPAREFILQHRLFRSDKTGEIIDKRFTLLSYPSRWRYDILRVLDYFRAADLNYDTRMQDAFDVLLKKKRPDGTWPLQGKHPGQFHFEMEPIGKPSRWNTLRALRVLNHFGIST
jgi:hypothetical protein